MNRLWCVLALAILVATLSVPATGKEITPAEVYAQAVRIEKEMDLLKAYRKVSEIRPVAEVHATLLPRHVWQECYLIQLKINIFRRQNNFPVLSAQTREPVRDLEPLMNYEQTQRLLTEIGLLKLRLGISDQIPPQEVVPGKTPMDVFNKLHFISRQWDVINHSEVSPSDVYAEVLRVDEDVNALLVHLGIQDTAYPPAKVADVPSAEVLTSAFAVLTEVQRLQQMAGQPQVDFAAFHIQEETSTTDVLDLVSMIQAELQTLKAYLGLLHVLTPVAERQGEKTKANVNQFLGYVANKLRLIRSF
ncbi:MAG: hypothetical protein HQL87_00805 [Magnetococcales bacterium]|nr:hypothetical protein [Magnetococcales bacterium]